MKFYTRKLHNVEDLEQERKKILKQKKRMDKEPILALDSVLSTAKKEKETDSNSLLSFLPVSAPVLGIITGILKRRLFNSGSASPSRKRRVAEEDRQAGKSLGRRILMDIAGSYLKWKAIELTYKGTKKIIRKQQAKKAERKAAEPLTRSSSRVS